MTLRSFRDQTELEDECRAQSEAFKRFAAAWARHGRTMSARLAFDEGWDAALARRWRQDEDKVAVCTVCDRSTADPACRACTVPGCPKMKDAA